MKDNPHRNCERIETLSKQALKAEELLQEMKWFVQHVNPKSEACLVVTKLIENLQRQNPKNKVVDGIRRKYEKTKQQWLESQKQY